METFPPIKRKSCRLRIVTIPRRGAALLMLPTYPKTEPGNRLVRNGVIVLGMSHVRTEFHLLGAEDKRNVLSLFEEYLIIFLRRVQLAPTHPSLHRFLAGAACCGPRARRPFRLARPRLRLAFALGNRGDPGPNHAVLRYRR